MTKQEINDRLEQLNSEKDNEWIEIRLLLAIRDQQVKLQAAEYNYNVFRVEQSVG